MSRYSKAVAVFFALLAQPGDAVTRAALTRAALNLAKEDRLAGSVVELAADASISSHLPHRSSAHKRTARPIASLVELAADASIYSSLSHGISAHERVAMRQLTAKMGVSARDLDARHAAPPATAATMTAEQLPAAATDQRAPGTSAARAANASVAELAAGVASDDAPEVAAAAPEAAVAEASIPTVEAKEVAAAEVTLAADSPQSAADDASDATSTEATSAKDVPATEDVLSSIDRDLLAALTNASSVLTNASQAADLELSGLNATDSIEVGDHAADVGVPPSPFDPLPGQIESNATDGPLDGELGQLISDLHNRIDNGVAPAAVNAETKSSEYTKSLEELRDSIVSFKQGVGHFEDRAKAKHRAVMRRVQQALDAQRSAPASSPNSTSAVATAASPDVPAQSEPAAPASPALQEPSPPSPPSPMPVLAPTPPLA